MVTTTLSRPSATRDWKLTGFDIRVASEQELAVNKLTLAGKGLAHYVFLAGMILSPALMLAAVAKLVSVNGRRRRLWWALPAIIGVCVFRMNWTTGEYVFSPLHIMLLGVGATTIPTGFDPWMMSFSIPVVAILILTGVIGGRSKTADQDG